MIRPKWFAHATTLQRRCLTYSRPTFREHHAKDAVRIDSIKDATAINRRQRSKAKDSDSPDRRGNTFDHRRRLWDRRSSASREPRPQRSNWRAVKSAEQTVVTISGLSPSLKASDFNRIAVQDLKDWSSAISKVFQERDALTLEPLGKWHVSFDSAAAADSFENKVRRLHELSQYKMSDKDGLWKNRVPNHLLSDRDMEEEVKAFTLAPGSQASLQITRNTENTDWGCQQHIQNIIKNSYFPRSNSVVLATLQRPFFNTDDLEKFIKEDGEARRSAWKIGRPWSLDISMKDESSDSRKDTMKDKSQDRREGSEEPPILENLDYKMKLETRFALVCRDADEAWRFIRQWNQRLLEGHSTKTRGTERTMVNVSLIEQQ